MKRTKTLAVGTLACATALTALPMASHAAQTPAAKAAAAKKAAAKNGPGGALVYGSLTATGTGTATVQTPAKTSITVALAPAAKFTARTQAAANAGYKTGDQVLIRGRYVNGFTGNSVVYDTAPFPVAAAVVTGKVASSAAQSLSLTVGKTTKTVALTSTTRFVVNGKLASSPPTFTANERVRIQVQQLTDGTTVARQVASGKLNPVKTIRVAGTIAQVGTGSLTLTRKNGTTVTITINANTHFVVGGQVATTAPALAANQQIVVQGVRQANGSIVARRIAVQATSTTP